MWDWAHFKNEGWLAHTNRSIRLGALLLLSGATMVLHALVPFWQQPKRLQRSQVASALCEGLEPQEE
tara:strand:+ start:1159 stop:1359 length:201 start_codon:yes stop_codon:yes gene_type:complete